MAALIIDGVSDCSAEKPADEVDHELANSNDSLASLTWTDLSVWMKDGACADLIIVVGNLLEKLELVGDPEKNFVVIMKDGTIYKNTL